MKRKFTTVSTGRVNDAESGSEKWAGSAAAQVATAENVKSILTKTIPVDFVICDPENPRKLDLTLEQVKTISNKYPLDLAKIEVDESTDWIDQYVLSVSVNEGLSVKATADLESLVGFAAALKSSTRLLHPIVVWRDESTFHLIAGERRLLAHVLLREIYIAARITDHGSRSEIDILQWEENVHRVDMSLWERVAHVKRIVEASDGVEKTTVTKLAKILGKSRADCQRYLVVLRYPTNLLIDSIQSGKVNDLKLAASLAQISPADLQAKLSGGKGEGNTSKPFFKFTAREKAPQMGVLLMAAAKSLNMENVIADLDFTKTEAINAAIVSLVAELEIRNRA